MHPNPEESSVPIWDVKPVLALDVYEHAYYADFLTARAATSTSS